MIPGQAHLFQMEDSFIWGLAVVSTNTFPNKNWILLIEKYLHPAQANGSPTDAIENTEDTLTTLQSPSPITHHFFNKQSYFHLLLAFKFLPRKVQVADSIIWLISL